MKMRAVYSKRGQLLGHIDLDYCMLGRNFYLLDDTLINPVVIKDIKPSDEINIFRFYEKITPFKENGNHDTYSFIHLVAMKPIPQWVWKTGKAVKFSFHQWKEIR